MQAEEQMAVRCTGRIFLALCIILFMGCTTQGGPVETDRHTRVRCRPDALSSNCLEEQGEQTVIPDGAADVALPLKADPVETTKSPEPSDSSAVSEDVYGSGSEMELESGSGFDDSTEGFATPDLVLHQSGQDPNFRLTDEGLFLQGEQL